MTPTDMRQCLEQLFSEREARCQVNSDLHRQHHEWIEERIEAEKARKVLYMEAAKAFAQWSVVGIAGAVWYFFRHELGALIK